MFTITIKEEYQDKEMTRERVLFEQKVPELDQAAVIAVINNLVKKATEPGK